MSGQQQQRRRQVNHQEEIRVLFRYQQVPSMATLAETTSMAPDSRPRRRCRRPSRQQLQVEGEEETINSSSAKLSMRHHNPHNHQSSTSSSSYGSTDNQIRMHTKRTKRRQFDAASLMIASGRSNKSISRMNTIAATLLFAMGALLIAQQWTAAVAAELNEAGTSQLASSSAAALVSAQAPGNGDKQQQQQQQQQQQNGKELAATNNNVIIIKYANVSDSTQQNQKAAPDSDDQRQEFAEQSDLQVYKLYEPLSVAVIESKFAHAIQLFDVSHNQLSTLSKDLFCPLSNHVRQLNISHNLLENFDCLGLISQAGQLCLSELRILDMSHNLIKHLPATGVATLHNLEVLNLSNNLIESLDELSLSALYKLTKLDLSANKIQQLPVRIFHKSSSMQVLRLQSNFLQTSISQMFLSGLVALEELNLSHNSISHVNDSAFLDKVNLTRVDLSNNQLTGLRQEALRVTSVRQSAGYRHRLHHNGQYAGVAPKQTHSQSASAEFFLASNPFICDCQLEWMRKFQPNAIKRTVLSSSHQVAPSLPSSMRMQQFMLADQAHNDQLMQLTSSSVYQNDQPPVILASSSSSDSSAASNNNISEFISSTNGQLATDNSAQQQHGRLSQASSISHHYARISDLDLIKCTPLFRRNVQRSHHKHHDSRQQQSGGFHQRPGQSRWLAPSDGSSYHVQQQHLARQQDAMIDLSTADSSNFLCRYKSHCFALCHCCEFDACDCEMICPNGCNCYYDSTWQTNIIDCSSNNHSVVPDRIPMDVSGLYLDGNNIDSLKPSNLIARKLLKTLYLNSSNLQYIANRTFNGLIELQTLYLHDNMLRSLNGYEFEPLAQLRALYLQSNRLDHISNQTFIYLRSLEILDLSNNRLTSVNIDLFWSIGHHNIRLRQLSLAHNWWSCESSSADRFRQILKQKFLLNGSVNIADKNQLRCHHNSTSVGPLILSEGSTSGPLYTPYPTTNNRQQQEQRDQQEQQEQEFRQQEPMLESPIYPPPILIVQGDTITTNSLGGDVAGGFEPSNGGHHRSTLTSPASMPLTSFILLSILFAGIMVIAVSIFVFVRQQQRFHQSHHKKSSAASTTSASSSASSTAISSLNGKSHRHHPSHHNTLHGAQHLPHHHHHLIMSNGTAGGATTTSINHHQLQDHMHHHSASSQSNIYAALVSPTAANSTTVANASSLNINGNNMASSAANNNSNNLYSNSSTTASHHSSSSHGMANAYPGQHWQNQQQQHSVYSQPYGGIGALEGHYAINASSQASYKTGSIYNAPGNCHEALGSGTFSGAQNDWMKMPKVKQFMSKLVNKSLALGGYRSCSRDELSAATSDKIYDAFISYDKRDEAFVMQHLSAELEYGEPQYRIADRYRDLPLPTSAYIAEAIASVIGCSHRTIIVLTENYLASDWCRYELQAALHESSLDKAHKIIAVVMDPKCLLDMDNEMRVLLTNSNVSIYQTQQQQPQLVQLDGSSPIEQQQHLVTTLTNRTGGNHQVSTQTAQLATSKITFINYNERKFWQKIKQLMPTPRHSTQTLTLTTKN